MRDGDERELTAFVAACGPSWQRLAFMLTGNWHDAEDVVAATVVRLFRAWPRVVAAGDPRAYATRVVINESNRWLRRARPSLPLDTAVPQAVEMADVAGQEAMWRAITALPRKQRSVVVLRYYLDWSERDIADVLGCSNGTVKSQASKALAALRRALVDDHELEGSTG